MDYRNITELQQLEEIDKDTAKRIEWKNHIHRYEIAEEMCIAAPRLSVWLRKPLRGDKARLYIRAVGIVLEQREAEEKRKAREFRNRARA